MTYGKGANLRLQAPESSCCCSCWSSHVIHSRCFVCSTQQKGIRACRNFLSGVQSSLTQSQRLSADKIALSALANTHSLRPPRARVQHGVRIRWSLPEGNGMYTMEGAKVVGPPYLLLFLSSYSSYQGQPSKECTFKLWYLR